MTNSIDDLADNSDVVFVIGSNTTEAHPIAGLALIRAARRGAKLIVVDPRRIPLADHAEMWLPMRPGGNVALVDAMMKVIVDEGLHDRAFVEKRTEGFDRLTAMLADFDLEAAAETCGIPLEDIRAAARTYASADAAAIVYAMGVTQSTSGTDQVRALADLAMLTGNIGRPGTGVNPLRGQNNVQGACDMGCLPATLPGYARVDDPAARQRFARLWGKGLPETPGLALTEMFDAALDGRVRAMYVMGENPVISDPDQDHVVKALSALEFLVVQDIFLTETAKLADVVLPGVSFAEKNGTFTNTERRVQRVRRAIPEIGKARSDWRIISQFSSALGYSEYYRSARAIMREIAEAVPTYAGVTYERLVTGGLQWPCPSETHPGTPILHTKEFTRGRGLFAAVGYTAPGEPADEGYPMVMTTGRVLLQYHTGSMTRRVAGLEELCPEGRVEINTQDAAAIGVADGDPLEVTGRRGTVTMRSLVTDRVRPGVIFMPFHFAEAPANRLTGGKLDPHSKMPGLKYTAVTVRKAATAS